LKIEKIFGVLGEGTGIAFFVELWYHA
jgi:hypothetical protein